jgi:hypothetical protein
MKTSFIVIAVLISCITDGQHLPVRKISINGGYSRHGSGDLNGIVFGADYTRYYKNRFSLKYDIRGFINDGEETIIVTDPSIGYRADNSIRWLVAAVQTGINARYSIIRTRKHEFITSLGVFGKYQSEVPDGYSLYSPARTGIPAVLVEFNNNNPQESFAIGGLFSFEYNFTLKGKVSIGISPAFQADTHGDAIPHIMLCVGRRF